MKRSLSWIGTLLTAAVVMIGQMQPANAQGTWFDLEPGKSSCGFPGHSGWRPALTAHATVGNDGVQSRGYILDGAGVSWSMSSNCTRFVARTLEQAYGGFTVSAKGWGIDGFSVTAGWPSVNVSGWDKSVRRSLDWGGGHSSGTWTMDGTKYFNAGSAGDVSSMRIATNLTFAAYSGDQLDYTVSQTSGNIQ